MNFAKILFIGLFVNISLASFCQSKNDSLAIRKIVDQVITTAKGDTLEITKAKFIKIGDRIYKMDAFTNYQVLFLPLQSCYDILKIIDERSYGTLPGSAVQAIINFISQQLPPK